MGYRKKLKASSEDHGEAKNASELDPTQLHYCTAYPAEDLETFRCGSVKKMAMHILEPSILIGFLCRDEKDWGDFKKRVSDLPRSILSVNSRPPSIISDYEANMGFTSVSRQTATLGPELDDSDQLFVLRRAPTHLDDSQSANQISSGRPSHRVAGGSQKKPMKEEPDEMTPPQEEHTGAPQKTPSTLKIAHISTWASSPSDSDDSSPFSSSGLYSASPVLRSYTTRERTFDTNVNPVKFVIRKKMRARRKNHHVLSTSESSPKFDTDSPSLPSE
ncbi:hypothetical protein BDZ97DRAFT_142187 [Flammula alnicola]|nr:hypothetical protein BDZ97DRAFT_142187 [Flammula alnicola]